MRTGKRLSTVKAAKHLAAVILLLGFSNRVFAADSISVKNFRQIFDSLRVITGVVPDAEVNQAYQDAKNRLPRYGRIDEVSSPMLLAVTAVSGSFCKKMIAIDASIANRTNRRAHRMVDFTLGPSGMTSDIRRSVIQEYSRLFWQRDPVDSEIQTVLTTMADAATAIPTTTPADTQKVLKVACTAVASSLESYIY